MEIKRAPIHYKHPTTVYIPVFQVDFDKEGNLLSYPTFEYSLKDGSTDEQMALSFNPDYVLVLTGEFDATTKPIVFSEEE